MGRPDHNLLARVCPSLFMAAGRLDWPVATLITAGLDIRFGSSARSTPWIQCAALGVVALGSALTIWATASDRFFYGFVRT